MLQNIIPILRRYGAISCLAVLMAGCSSTDSGGGGGGVAAATSRLLFGTECGWNRDSCLYEGRYEPGERHYAEVEARRLNQASLERLRQQTAR